MSVSDTIDRKLRDGLNPTHLAIIDDSEKHRGHMGYREGGETHFRVTIVSDAFQGQSRVARQQAVFALLKDEMDNPIHALSLRTLTPAEAENQDL